jgi:hypothetical protein
MLRSALRWSTSGDNDFVQNTKELQASQNSTIAFGILEFDWPEKRAITNPMLEEVRLEGLS